MLIPENGNYGVTVNTPQPVEVRLEIGNKTQFVLGAALILLAAWIKKKGK
ncbi:hypothetical protein [Agarivorans sp. QJM3NY_25]